MSQVPDETSTELAMTQSAVDKLVANFVASMTAAGHDQAYQQRQLDFVRDMLLCELSPHDVEFLRTLSSAIGALGDDKDAKKEALNHVRDIFAGLVDTERANASMAPEPSIPAESSVLVRDEDNTGAPDQQMMGKDSKQG